MSAKTINSVLTLFVRKAYFAVPLVGLTFSGLLYLLRETSYPSFFIVTLLAWIASDFFIIFFIRGGSGIVQIPIFGTKSQFKGIGFMMFFIAIFVVSIIVNVLTSALTDTLSLFLSNPFVCLAIGFVLTGLVFADLTLKYYRR